VSTNTSDISTLQGEQSTQDTAIALNTAKVSYDDTEAAAATAAISTLQSEQSTQDTAIALNTAKTGISAGQAAEITANTAKLSYTDAAVVAGHTSDIATLQGEQTTQDTAIALNTAKVSYDDTEAAAATAAITTLQGEQSTQDAAIALNTAKTGITAGQASEITANTAKVSYTDAATVATAIQPTDTVADLTPIAASTQSGTTYTLALSNVFGTVMLSNAALVTVTIPTNASVAFPTGTQIALHSLGAGGVTLTTTSLTLNGSPNKTIAQNEIMVLEKTATDTWSVYGGTAA
jgi:hypothetical protein